MNTTFFIEHKDLKEIGYFFLNSEEENAFLKNVNDTFAIMVGNEMTKHISAEKAVEISGWSPQEICNYLQSAIPEYDEIIKDARNNVLDNLREKRKKILTKAQNERIFEGSNKSGHSFSE